VAVRRTNDQTFVGWLQSTSATLSPTGDWAVYGWVKFGTGITTKAFWSCGDGTDTFLLESNGTNVILKQGASATVRLTGTTTLALDTWYWIAITKSSATITIYLGTESTQAASEASGDSSGWGTLFTAAGQRFFGGRGEGNQLGTNSEMAYWRSLNGSALDLTQLRAEQYKKSAVVTTNLRTEYDFASASAKLTDSGPNSFTLTDGDSVNNTWADGTDPTGLSEPDPGGAPEGPGWMQRLM
jgi:hypothetical protein